MLMVGCHRASKQLAWKRYSFPLETHVKLGDPLVSRIWREFRRWSLTITKSESMKSVFHERRLVVRRETPVSSSITMVENLVTVFCPYSVIDYYWGFWTLSPSWAQAGNYEVDAMSIPGKCI